MLSTPSAPRPTRPTANTSAFSDGEQVTVEPSASTSSNARTCVARPPKREPVPCVPVETAPATVCASMSPRLVIDNPRLSSTRLSRRRVMPASTVTRPVRASAASSRSWRSRTSCRSSGRPMPVNECPEPMALARRPAASLITRAISSPRGWTISGSALRFPAQFDQPGERAARPLRRRATPGLSRWLHSGVRQRWGKPGVTEAQHVLGRLSKSSDPAKLTFSAPTHQSSLDGHRRAALEPGNRRARPSVRGPGPGRSRRQRRRSRPPRRR